MNKMSVTDAANFFVTHAAPIEGYEYIYDLSSLQYLAPLCAVAQQKILSSDVDHSSKQRSLEFIYEIVLAAVIAVADNRYSVGIDGVYHLDHKIITELTDGNTAFLSDFIVSLIPYVYYLCLLYSEASNTALSEDRGSSMEIWTEYEKFRLECFNKRFLEKR